MRRFQYHEVVAVTQSPPSLQSPSVRRCAAELLAIAIIDVLPGIAILDTGITGIGFYCDISSEQLVDDGVFAMIEQRFRSVIKDDLPIKTMEMVHSNAAELLRHHGLEGQLARLDEMTDPIVAILNIDGYFGLCPEPHIASSREAGMIKLLDCEEVQQDGEEERGGERVYRLTGTAAPDKKALKAFLKRMEQAKRSDHRILGEQLDLFSTSDEVGEGLWLWHPKGASIRESLLDWWRLEHKKQRFQLVSTPQIVNPALLQEAGWYDALARRGGGGSSFVSEGSEYTLSPTNAPLHALVYQSKPRSYRELPVRYAECSELYHHGSASQLWGVFKARAYHADSAHLFCTSDQVVDELISSLQFINQTVRIFGFQHGLYLNARSARFAGTVAQWDRGVQWIVEALESCGLDYQVEDTDNGGIQALSGPRLDFKLIDALGREWCGPSVGLDFNTPERFGLRYQGKDGKMHVPLMITRSMFGSLERFVAILVEQCGGHFPLWLAPEQVRVLPVTEDQADYAAEVAEQLEHHGFRAHVDYRREVLKAKVHSFEEEKVPFAVVVGRQEQQKHCLTYRRSQMGKVVDGVDLSEFVTLLERECKKKDLPGMTGATEKRDG